MIVVIPIAGGDEAFRERGYSFCKQLIEIHGRPLIEHVWTCLRTLNADRYVFIIKKEDAQRFHLHEVLRLMDPTAVVVRTEGPTAGAACTALLAIEHIDSNDELVIANGDQLFHFDLGTAIADFRRRGLDAGSITFDSLHPRWSFVRLGDDGLVIEAAEKRPISRTATAGFYYFKRGDDFIQAAAAMIKKDAHVNGAFYVCPTFNEMILHDARIGVFTVERDDYVSLATPQNLEEYEQSLASRAAAEMPRAPRERTQ